MANKSDSISIVNIPNEFYAKANVVGFEKEEANLSKIKDVSLNIQNENKFLFKGTKYPFILCKYYLVLNL